LDLTKVESVPYNINIYSNHTCHTAWHNTAFLRVVWIATNQTVKNNSSLLFVCVCVCVYIYIYKTCKMSLRSFAYFTHEPVQWHLRTVVTAPIQLSTLTVLFTRLIYRVYVIHCFQILMMWT
jgi:hypothetical protein